MRKRFLAICSVLIAAIVLLALVPGCDGVPTTGTIEVHATLDGLPWTGLVDYTLTGPGAAAPIIINGTSVSTNHTAEAGNWSCAYVGGGPGVFVDITPSPAQTLAAGGTIGFTLNFETPEQVDASIEFKTWTINGVPVDPGWYFVGPGDIIDIEYTEHVSGEEDAVVTVDQTSWLKFHNKGYEGEQGPPITLHVVNAPGAVKMNPPADKLYQQATHDGDPVQPCTQIDCPYCVEVLLDVEIGWELVVCNNYTKTINWIGFPPTGTMILQDMDVVFDVVSSLVGAETIDLTSKACIEVGEGFEDTNPDNDCTDWCPLLTVTYLLPP